MKMATRSVTGPRYAIILLTCVFGFDSSIAQSTSDADQTIVITGSKVPVEIINGPGLPGGYWERSTRSYDPLRFDYNTIFRSSEMVNQTSTSLETGTDTGTTGASCGNPVILKTGNKIERDVDFASVNDFGLTLERTYNQLSDASGLFGASMHSSLDERLIKTGVLSGDGLRSKLAYLTRAGEWRYFLRDGLSNRWNFGGIPNSYDYVLRDSSGQWVMYHASGAVMTFASGGSLLRSVTPQGVSWFLQYSNPNFEVLGNSPNPTLTRITHSNGRFIQVSISAIGAFYRITSVTDPIGKLYSYSYTSTGFKLAAVTYPTSTGERVGSAITRTIGYGYDSGFRLIGKYYNGVRYSSFGYDTYNRVVTEEHAGGVDRYEFQYLSTTGSSTYVRNALGQGTYYTFDGQGDIASSNGLASVYCTAAITSSIEDAVNRTRVNIDADGSKVRIKKDQFGNVIERVLGFELGLARTLTYEWTLYPRRLSREISPTGVRAYGYGADNRLSAVTDTDLTSAGLGQSRTTTYAYTDANGDGIPERLVVDGPLPGSGDAVQYDYDAFGNILSAISSLGMRQFLGYNALGYATSAVDENGSAETVALDARNQVTSRSKGGVTMGLGYNAKGDVAEVSSGGAMVTTSFDAAFRVTGMSKLDTFRGADKKDVMTYTRDTAGNVLTSVAGQQSSLTVVCYGSYPGQYGCWPGTTITITPLVKTTREYDERSRVRTLNGANGQRWSYTYSPQGKLLTVTDAASRVTQTNTYDSLGRLSTQRDPLGGVVTYGYDVGDRLAFVTDPRGLITSYVYDGFGNLRSLISPDTGLTSYVYNSVGQLTAESRADGSLLSYTYLGDGRVAAITSSRDGSGMTRTPTLGTRV
jgi:YD repeat-containing protein